MHLPIHSLFRRFPFLVSTPSSPNPLHVPSRPTTPLFPRSSALWTPPPPPPAPSASASALTTPTFFSLVGDRSELFCSPPRPRSADGGFAADAFGIASYSNSAPNDHDLHRADSASPTPSEGNSFDKMFGMKKQRIHCKTLKKNSKIIYLPK